MRRAVVNLAVAGTLAVGTIAIGSGANAMAATVTLSPQNDIQTAVNANPAGTTFVLQPGTHRGNSVTSLRNGDSFIGQAGAVMDGAKVLNGWTQVIINGVVYWTTAGGTPLPTGSVGTSWCDPAFPACAYVQDLYVNGVEYTHVISLANIVAGASWYYDFDGTDGGVVNNIYLAAGEGPLSKTVELGATSYAFQGTASNITIKNLVIEKYAPQLSHAAVEANGPGWLIQGNEVRLNHSTGITAKPGAVNIQVLGNNVHHNGGFGMGGPGSDGLWDSNTVTYNNTDGMDVGGGYGGGTKFTGDHVMVSNNIVHDNNGSGLWTDDGGTYITYNHNTSYNNFGDGIRYEISRYGTITNNVVYGNTNPSLAEIAYAGSDHGRIAGNTVVDFAGHGAIAVTNIVGSRPNSTETIYKVTDTQVTGNTIEILSGKRNTFEAGLIDHAQPSQPSIFSDPTNFFNNNIYEFPHLSTSSWHWGETPAPLQVLSWSTWQANSQDMNGQVLVNVPGLGLNLPR